MKKVSIIILACIFTQVINSQKISNNNNLFGLNLLHQLKNGKENVFFSPYSISTALFMTTAGAQNNTATQMLKVLCLPENTPNYHKKFGEHLSQVENKKKITLNIANSIWKQKNQKFQNNFLQIQKEAYNAKTFDCDFANKPDKETNRINKWVASKTKNKIKDILQKGDIKPVTKLVLVNAIYFYGGWEHAFEKKNTSENIFTLNNNTRVSTDFMNTTYKTYYSSDKLFDVLSMPYEDDEASLLIFLPKSKGSIEKAIEKLDLYRYQALVNKMSYQKVNMQIPKFKTSSRFVLNDILTKMGMSDAFGSKADFSGMTGDKSLFISKVIHQAFVDVNEKGTEAAASTVVIMNRKAVAPKEKIIYFKADHPFIYMIRDNATGQILFVGVLNNPTK